MQTTRASVLAGTAAVITAGFVSARSASRIDAHPLDIEHVSVIDFTRLRARTRTITIVHVDDAIETRTRLRPEQLRTFAGAYRAEITQTARVGAILDALERSRPFPSPGSLEYRWLVDFSDAHRVRVESIAFASYGDSCLVGASTTARFHSDDFQRAIVAQLAPTQRR